MQPDNANPAASNPKMTLSEDMGTLPIESPAFAATLLRQKRDDSIKPLSAKTGAHASICALLPRCGSAAVAFMPQVLRVPLHLQAKRARSPDRGRADAASWTQMWIGG
jgi:hypothetical protein